MLAAENSSLSWVSVSHSLPFDVNCEVPCMAKTSFNAWQHLRHL